MRHVDTRVKSERLPWSAVKILSIRLLRHARKQYPESIPWIAALFSSQVSAVLQKYGRSCASRPLFSDITSVTNVILHLLSLPASINPVLNAAVQEKAQFQILQFMASSTPKDHSREGLGQVKRPFMASMEGRSNGHG
jgi:hypothetical protein